ncbi:MAG TPA: hypothetical protein VK762_26940 [Polyangiaceae bacterium]|nr:hypothetical protein [Polyangiaceae bacterium]
MKYTLEMRFSFTSLVLFALVACSNHSTPSAAVDSGDQGGGDDGSTAGCTSLGGTCEPIAAAGCPLLQQNDVLCGNVILVCCLPAGGATVGGGDDGQAGDDGGAQDGGQAGDDGPAADSAIPTDGSFE